MTDPKKRPSHFRFLSDEELGELSSRARMAYYIMAVAELDRRVNPNDVLDTDPGNTLAPSSTPDASPEIGTN